MTGRADMSSVAESKPMVAIDRPMDTDAALAGVEGMPDEGALLALARLGDGEAFGELCRCHEARIRRQARNLAGDPVVADEIAQDTLVAAWHGLPRFDGRSRFSTWLCAILLRQHRRRLRREWSLRRWFASDDGGSNDPCATSVATADGSGPASEILRSEQSDRVARCLKKLSVKHREVVVLRFYAEESLEGIAAVLGISVGTVKSRLFHALENLRKMRRDLTEATRHEFMP